MGDVKENKITILEAYGKPWFVIKTKQNIASDSWSEGEDVDLKHNCWTIRTEDPSKMQNADVSIHFEHVVDEGGGKASDPKFVDDLLTGKLLVLESLRGRYFRAVAAGLAEVRLNAFFWIVRWRRELGIEAMRDLSYPLFDQHCEILEKQGLQGLVSIPGRIARYEAEVHKGTREWPTYAIHRRTRLNFEQLATDLGIPMRMLVRRRPRSLLMASLSRTSSHLIKSTNQGLSDVESDGSPSFETFINESALRHLSVWQALHKLSDIGLLSHDPIQFDPFGPIKIGKRARQISRSSAGRTPLIEPEQWLQLLNGAARWVLDFSRPLFTVIERAKQLQSEIFQGSSRGAGPDKLKRFRESLQPSIDQFFNSSIDGVPELAAAWRRGNNWASDDKRIPLDEAVTFLVIACFILITGFSARRKNETLSAQEGCCWIDPFDNHWFSTYIEKSLRDIDKIPVPASVTAAVRVMEELSAPTRAHTGEPWLFKVRRPSNSSGEGEKLNLELNIGEGINRFAAMIGMKPIKGGEEWNFAAHQLRKAFGVYYYHGHRYASFDALSRFLRHYDPEMTRRYIADVLSGSLLRMGERIKARRLAHDEVQGKKGGLAGAPARDAAGDAARDLMDRARAFEEVRQEAYVERTMEVFDGVESPIGGGAARLYDELEQLIADARGSVVVKSRSNAPPHEVRIALIDRVRAVAKQRYREPVPGAHAHCGFQPGSVADLAVAKCLEEKRKRFGEIEDNRPDYAFASTETCLWCVHGALFSENEEGVNERVARLVVAPKMGATAERRSAAERKLQSLKAGLAAARSAVEGRGRMDE